MRAVQVVEKRIVEKRWERLRIASGLKRKKGKQKYKELERKQKVSHVALHVNQKDKLGRKKKSKQWLHCCYTSPADKRSGIGQRQKREAEQGTRIKLKEFVLSTHCGEWLNWKERDISTQWIKHFWSAEWLIPPGWISQQYNVTVKSQSTVFLLLMPCSFCRVGEGAFLW